MRTWSEAEAMGINSTPSLFINGEAVPLDSIKIDSLRQLIDTEIQKAMKTQSSSPANTLERETGRANAANK